MHQVAANGARIPAIGLGTWTLSGAACTGIVEAALAAGYRHVDTARMYGNEAEVGAALRNSGVARKELFVTTKVWYTDIAEADLLRSAEASVKRLGLDAVDLLLIHWPNPQIPLQSSMRGLNAAHRAGLARSIGVSNFPTRLLAQAIAQSEHPLACNQVEYHPYLSQARLKAACAAAGMALVAYSPLHQGRRLLSEAVIRRAAEAHGRTPAQIVLRWLVQQDGVAAIPRTTKVERLGENFDVSSFALSETEMAEISALSAAGDRLGNHAFSPVWDAD